MQFHYSLLFLLLLDFYYFLIISLLLLLLYRQLYKYTVNLGVENLTFIQMIFFFISDLASVYHHIPRL